MPKERNNESKKRNVLPEELIQRYVLVDELGEGGSGVVYKVKDKKLALRKNLWVRL